jgi:hypothetical protein
MLHGGSGDECGNLVLGQEYNRPTEAGVLKKPRGSDFMTFWKPAVFSFAGKEVPNLMDPLDRAILSHCTPQKQ